jgi:hypothetical protein
MSPARAFLLAGLLVAVGEAALGVVAWPTGLGPYLLACAAATALFAAATHRLIAPPDDGEGGDGGSRCGPAPDDEPPPWWPEFEREFHAHVQARDARPPVGGR